VPVDTLEPLEQHQAKNEVLCQATERMIHPKITLISRQREAIEVESSNIQVPQARPDGKFSLLFTAPHHTSASVTPRARTLTVKMTVMICTQGRGLVFASDRGVECLMKEMAATMDRYRESLMARMRWTSGRTRI